MADKSRLFAPYHRFCGFVAYIINSKIFILYFFYIKKIEHLYYSRKKQFLIIYCCLIFVDVMDDMNVMLYSGTSEKGTLWDQYKFKWFVPFIEVVLF